jgi:DinB superfamily
MVEPELFEERRLIGARFHLVDLTDATFEDVRLINATIDGALLHGLRMRNVEARELHIDGEVLRLELNGIDLVPLYSAELERRYPERARLHPADAAGYRLAWDTIEAMWAPTIERAAALAPPLLHARVNGEWSFIETLRHLVFATESWVHRVLLGDRTPWHPLSLPWDQMPDVPGIPRDRSVRPSLAEIMEVRADRMATVRRFVDELTEERLAGVTEPVDGPGFPVPRAYRVGEALDVVLTEEWWHHRFATRDLDMLTS